MDDADLAAVRADDELLDRIGRGEQLDDTELARVLVGWRAEVHAVPVPEIVDTTTATRAVRAGRLPWRYRVMFRVLRWFRRAL